MYLMMMVDGQMSANEQVAINGALKVLTRGLLDAPALQQILQHCERQARQSGVEARLESIGSRICADRVDRETAFSLAAAVAIADHALHDGERSLLQSIAQWYGISSKRCTQILQQFDDEHVVEGPPP